MSTTNEAAIRECVAKGMKFPEIARELNVNLYSLRSACSLLGIRSPRKPKKPKEPSRSYRLMSDTEIAQYLDDLRAGMTLGEIAAKHGRPGAPSIHHALNRRGLPTCAREMNKRESSKGAISWVSSGEPA